MPRSSPGRSTPVGVPKPKRRTQLSKRSLPSRRPIVIAPTLLDWARICGGRQRLGAARVRLADRAVGDLDLRRQVERRVGRDDARPRARPATVNALNVEPGS